MAVELFDVWCIYFQVAHRVTSGEYTIRDLAPKTLYNVTVVGYVGERLHRTSQTLDFSLNCECEVMHARMFPLYK